MPTDNTHPAKSIEATLPGHREPVLPDQELPLQTLYQRERESGSELFLVQPTTNGARLWTWAESTDESRRVAAYLNAQSWPPGSRVALLAKNSAWWIMADFAIWMAGFISVPIYAAIREQSLLAIFDQCQPVACFVGPIDQEFVAVKAKDNERFLKIRFITFPNIPVDETPHNATPWNEIVEKQSPLDNNPVRPGNDTATIIYTSGTTGNPKGVMQSFQSLALMAKSVLPALPPADKGSARILSYLPLAHIAERAIVEATSLYTPMQIFFVENQQTFLRDLHQAKPTIFFSIPRLLMRFQQKVFEKISEKKLDLLLRIPILRQVIQRRILQQLGLDTVKLAASGAAPLRVELLAWYRRLGLNLVEGYGMTETGITHVSLAGHLRAGYVGDASQYARTRISPEGEIQIQGPMNFLGYYQNPESTAASFTTDGYFLTGDRGEIDQEGRLRIVGRLKEEFKTAKGKYVIPAYIEPMLTASPLFDAVCVFGSGMAGPFVIAVLSANNDRARTNPSAKILLEHELQREIERVNAKLEHHEHLRFLVISEQPWTAANGFLTPTLKVRRAMIEQRYSSSFDAWEKSGKRIIWMGNQ